MRRLIDLVLCLSLAAVGLGQTWEKTLAPGLTYRMQFDAAMPRTVHALRFSPKSPLVRAVPELAGGTVYSDDETKGRETLSEMVARTKAIGGINADFFPFTGDPLGMMVREGELLSVPVRPRAVFGWGPESAAAGFVEWSISMTVEGGEPIMLDGFNEQCGQNRAVVNSPSAGLALSQQPATCVVLRVEQPKFGPSSEGSAEVESVFDGVTSVPVGEQSVLIMAHGTRAAAFAALRQGQKVTLTFTATGFDWEKAKSVIGGGPLLVQNGRPSIDWQGEGFRDDFANKRHPRTAVGRTQDGDIWFVAVDGRQEVSAGATLDELATLLVDMGCQEAINLDGGGSTTFNLYGHTMNRPTDGKVLGERKIANAILLYADLAPGPEEALSLASPDKILVGSQADAAILHESGSAVPNADVLWFASGPAFIDQGGRIRALGAGTATLGAWVRGRVIEKQIVFEPSTATPTVPPATAKAGN